MRCMPRNPQLMDSRVVRALAAEASAAPEGFAATITWLADLVQRAAGRSCAGCTLCCKLPAIEALGKPAFQWCAHCDPKSGCAIYEQRPQPCRDFICAWRAGYGPDGMKPSTVRLYVTMNPLDEGGVRQQWLLQADAGRADALRNRVVTEFLNRLRATGDPVTLRAGAQVYEMDDRGTLLPVSAG
jgi:hypothetical protein